MKNTKYIYISAKTCLLLVMLFLYFISMNAQDFRTDMLAISKKMNGLKTYSLTLKYQLYIDNKFDIPFQERKIIVKKNNKDFLCKQDNSLEVYASSTDQIIIDHRQKTFILLPKPDMKYNTLEPTGIFELYIDTILAVYDKVSYKDINSELGSYEYTFKQGTYYKMNLVFDKKTMIPKTIRYFPKQEITIKENDEKLHKVMLEVNYIGFKPNYSVDLKEMNINNYLFTENKKTHIKSKYKDYEFLNLQSYGDGKKN